MQRAGEIEMISHGYDGEVVYALVRLNVPEEMRARALATSAFAERTVLARSTISAQLAELAASGVRVAIWGGTGKGAAFIHHFGLDAQRFPLVVDSDPDKVGTFVPGAGQCIEFRDTLKAHPAEVVIIPTQWRAQDIVVEMRSEGISARKVLIEHDGQLIDFERDSHPYHSGAHRQ